MWGFLCSPEINGITFPFCACSHHLWPPWQPPQRAHPGLPVQPQRRGQIPVQPWFPSGRSFPIPVLGQWPVEQHPALLPRSVWAFLQDFSVFPTQKSLETTPGDPRATVNPMDQTLGFSHLPASSKTLECVGSGENTRKFGIRPPGAAFPPPSQFCAEPFCLFSRGISTQVHFPNPLPSLHSLPVHSPNPGSLAMLDYQLFPSG